MSKIFTINVGSGGSIVLLQNKSKIIESFYFNTILNDDDKKKLLELFNNNKKVPIYIILDNIGQNYTQKFFPKVGFFDLQNIVKRKFNYEIPKDDLKDKRFLGRDSATKKWKYMFISSPIDEFLNDWIELINQIENILDGIYMLPLESENILMKIKQKLKIKKNKNEIKWDIILVENQISGFREITFIDDKLTFTRILTEDTTNQDQFNIQFNENLSRTIEYLKRFYLNFNKDNLNIYIITSEKIKNFISKLDTKNNFKIKAFSCKEFAILFGLDKKLDNFLEYGDIIFEELIMSNKKIISFSTKEMKQLALMSQIINIFSKVIFLFIILFILIFGIGIINLTRNNYKIKNANENLEQINKKLENKTEQEFGSGLSNLDEIIDITSFYLQIKSIYKDPFEIIGKIANLMDNNIISNDLKWRMDKFTNNSFSNFKIVLNLDSSLINKSGKMDDLFKIYENINNLLKDNFDNYNIKISKLPKNINFNTNYFSFPLKIDLSEK